MSTINLLEYPNIAYGDVNGAFPPAGQYATIDSTGLLRRDPLGCNKLFYGKNHENRWVVASRIARALECGVNIDNLASCPPGHSLRLNENGFEYLGGEEITAIEPDDAFDPEKFRSTVRTKLDAAMDKVRRQFCEMSAAVCLSGGLDSSCVAAMAKGRFKDLSAYSFSYVTATDLAAFKAGADPSSLASASSDFQSAIAVANSLEIPFEAVLRLHEDAVSSAQRAINLCQDWRDFNVHCAVVNLFLAEHLAAAFPLNDVIVLTGDLMNEYVCDYHEEMVDGTIYYPQPRMALAKRRRFFVRGLDAGDRELGLFNAYQIPVIQIFAAVARDYLTVPEEILQRSDCKEFLNDHLLPEYVRQVVSTSKRRAQVGGEDGGTLALFHRAGLDQQSLIELWMEQLPGDIGNAATDIIHFGRYRTQPRVKD